MDDDQNTNEQQPQPVEVQDENESHKNYDDNDMIANGERGGGGTKEWSRSFEVTGEYEGDKMFQDSIHGCMHLPSEVVKMMDTTQFQRLRGLKQLGTACYVYPTAVHTRFEHSIGTAYLAGKWLDQLGKEHFDQNELRYWRTAVMRAGLLHDLGHGPFSHVFDHSIIPNIFPSLEGWEHEAMSVTLFEYLLSDNAFDLDSGDVQITKDMILGRSNTFPTNLVKNSRSGIDVDKIDYIQRDSRAINIPVYSHSDRLLHRCKVLSGEWGNLLTMFHRNDYLQVYELFHSRYLLHRFCYQHPVGNAVGHMIADAYSLMEPFIDLRSALYDPELFCDLDDSTIFSKASHIRKSIAPADRPNFFNQADGLLKRIDRRDLYKMEMERFTRLPVTTSPVRLATLETMLTNLIETTPGFRSSQFKVSVIRNDYTKLSDNPLDYVDCYSFEGSSYRQHSELLTPIQLSDVGGIFPDSHQELCFRIYSKNQCGDQNAKLHQMSESLSGHFIEYVRQMSSH